MEIFGVAENVVPQKMLSEVGAEKNLNSGKIPKIKNSEKSTNSKKTKKVKNSKTCKSRKTNSRKNVVSQKRFVSAVKVFLTDKEKKEILAKMGNFKSVSNYIRHQLGLMPNEVGRKRHFTESPLDLNLNDFAEIGDTDQGENNQQIREKNTPPAIKTDISAPEELKTKKDKSSAENRQLGLWDW